jgi:adenylate kinase family enzyme
MKPHAFVFIGRSGCGKGTQADLLKKKLTAGGGSVFYVETGDMFRNFIQGEGYSQKLSKTLYEDDTRQPDFLACYMWSTFLVRDFDGLSHVVFDGTPRSVLEAKLLETAFAFYGFEKVHIIHLNVSREWSEKHLLARGRSDDATLAKIDTRLNWFDKDVVPAIEHFKNSGNHFVEVNGEQSIEEVHTSISSALDLSL